MKCPKCGYLGFDDGDRCRNCGYEFSLAGRSSTPELPLRSNHPTERFGDLALLSPGQQDDTTADAAADIDRILRGPAAESAPVGAGRLSADATHVAATRSSTAVSSPEPNENAADLPLFGGPITDDVPLITKASPPRAPLSVRRSTPEVPRVRSDSTRPPALDLRFDLAQPEGSTSAGRSTRPAWADSDSDAVGDAGLIARVVAAGIDLGILALIDAVVVYFTMQICGLTPADLALLPKGPLLAFLAVQNGGYLVAFTAGGQTLGKMATGIRVVTASSGSSLDVSHAVLRTLAWILLAVPAGLGFLPALFSADHRGLHDRFAGSRVVRTTA
jgi:uncharacterized RDD family membrane protein YckC